MKNILKKSNQLRVWDLVNRITSSVVQGKAGNKDRQKVVNVIKKIYSKRDLIECSY